VRTFKQFAKAKTIPMGHCFEFAWEKARELFRQNQEGTVVHGTITQPFSQPPEKNLHAWVEVSDIVYDWQCMQGGCGGKFMGKGFPKKTFYELFKPKKMKYYTPEQAMVMSIKHGHKGPWE
jgi:hypothetical protein